MDKPRTDREALFLLFDIVGSKTKLAIGLGVTKQLVSRWKSLPPPYAERASKLTKLPIDWVLPELDAKVSALLKKPSAAILPALIRLFYPESKS